MALVLKIRVTGVTYDNPGFPTFIVEDENDTLDITEQYGDGANPARADLGVFLYVTRKNVGDDVDVLVYGEADNTDPENTALWTIPYVTDNWFEHVLIAAVDWDTGEAGYVLNDLVHDNNKLWLAVAPVQSSTPGAVTGEWTDVTSDHTTILTSATGTYDYNVVLNDVRLEVSATYYAKLIAASSKNGQCLNCNHDNKDRENLIKFHLNAAQVACDQQLFTQAQYNVVVLKNLCAS